MATVAAALALAPGAAAMPTNFCTFRLGPQLRALAVSSNCLWTRTTLSDSARWGLVTRGVTVTVWRRVSRQAFEARFALGTPVSLGSFAREDAQPLTVTVDAWVRGHGLTVVAIDERSGGGPDAATVLAFARAVARQL